MRILYEFIEKILKNKFNSTYNEHSIKIEFSYFNGLENILEYNKYKQLNDENPNVLTVYKYKTVVDELNLNNFLNDEDEYNEEIIDWNTSECKYKLIINNENLIKLIYPKDRCNIRLYLDRDQVLEDINIEPKNYKDLEDKIFKFNKNIILIIDSDSIFYNNYCLIIGLKNNNLIEKINKFIEYYPLENIGCELRKISCSWIEGPSYLNPNHTFFYRDNQEFNYDYKILNKFGEFTINLFVLSISNFSGEIDGKFKSILNSNKRIEIIYGDTVRHEYSEEKNLYTIYNWIYTIPSIDKLNICRNVISALIVATKCQNNILETIIKKSELLLISLKDNLESYAQENVSKFFEEKNKRKKDLLKDISSVMDQTDLLIKLMINNISSLIAVSIAGVIAYLAKSDFLVVKILGILYVLQLDVTIFLNIPINIIKVLDANKNFNYIKKKYEETYFRDEDIGVYENKMKKNKTILMYYSIGISILIILVNVIAYNVIFNNEFLKWILNKLV